MFAGLKPCPIALQHYNTWGGVGGQLSKKWTRKHSPETLWSTHVEGEICLGAHMSGSLFVSARASNVGQKRNHGGKKPPSRLVARRQAIQNGCYFWDCSSS